MGSLYRSALFISIACANGVQDIVIYTSDDGKVHLDVRMEDETLWLSQQQMAELYQTSRTNVVEHIKHIYEEQELDVSATCRYFRQVRTEGIRQVEREIPFYNLDMIISLGYPVNSHRGVQFPQWVTQIVRSTSCRPWRYIPLKALRGIRIDLKMRRNIFLFNTVFQSTNGWLCSEAPLKALIF